MIPRCSSVKAMDPWFTNWRISRGATKVHPIAARRGRAASLCLGWSCRLVEDQVALRSIGAIALRVVLLSETPAMATFEQGRALSATCRGAAPSAGVRVAAWAQKRQVVAWWP
jgi:hypothetical protein